MIYNLEELRVSPTHTVAINDSDDDLARIRLKRLRDVTPTRIEWAWDGRIPLGSLSLLVGLPEQAKTTLALELAARLSTGTLGGSLEGVPRHVLIASTEDAIEQTLAPRLLSAGADPDRVSFVSVSRPGEGIDGILTLPDDADGLAEKIVTESVSLVVLDPLTSHLNSKFNTWNDSHVRRALAPLRGVAESTGCAILGIAHLNKMPTTDLFAKVGGSMGLPAVARSILLAAGDPEDDTARVLLHGKCNLAPRAPTLRYRTESRTIEDEDAEITTVGITWCGEASGINVADVLAPVNGDERGALLVAVSFLEDVLADGSVAAKEVKMQAAEAGVTARTLERAKERLGIRPRKVGFSGGWLWSLPKQDGA